MVRDKERTIEATVDAPNQQIQSAKTEEVTFTQERAQLVVLAGKEVGRRYPIAGEVIIGRLPSATIWLPEKSISRHHAKISENKNGQFVLEDLNSRNGTSINGVTVTKHILEFGDKINFGSSTILVFTFANPLEEQLLQLQKMEAVGRLAAGVAHEFNNLLAVVVNNLSLLEQPTTLEEHEKHICVLEAKQAANRGAELARQMLDFSRLSTTNKSLVDISSLMQEVEQLIRRTFSPMIKVSTDVDSQLFVYGDRLQLYQALMNLCLNARDAMPEGGHFRIVAKATENISSTIKSSSGLEIGPYILISISDTGEGMSAETVQKAFDPFFTTKPLGKGTGLGLSTVLGIINNHQGKIELQSEIGRGTTFIIYLPQAYQTKDVSKSMPRKGGKVSSRRYTGTILFVDDDELVCNSIRRALRSFGFNVFTACDGHEAISIYKKQRNVIQLVILDVLMPVMGGQKTYDALRELNPDVKVLVCSGYADKEVVNRLLDKGATGFLKKPFDSETLRQVIIPLLQEIKEQT